MVTRTLRALSAPVRIVGVDPGLTRCGVGIVDVWPDRTAALVAVSVVRTPTDAPTAERLAGISHGISAMLDEHEPDVMAVERVFAQHNTRTVMGTAQASGVALLAAAHRSMPTALHTPSEVKAAVTGYGAAEKRQVQTMVARILRLDELPKPADAADALALAICHGWRPAAREGGAPVGDDELTAAQRAWRNAESLARRRR